MIDKDTIIKLAREAGMPISETFGPMVGACPVGDLLEHFAAAVYRQGLEDATKTVEGLTAEIRFQSVDHYKFAHASAAAIRALKDTP